MKKGAQLSLLLSMLIFGTIGLFVRRIPFPSAFVAMTRGFIGGIFILVLLLVTRKGLNFCAIKKNIVPLVISGALIGANWIFLFESYKYTTVAIATLCYYMAPLFVTVGSVLIFKEKFTYKKAVCILVAVFGMFLVSGVVEGKLTNGNHLIGIILGLVAAILYATITLTSKTLKDISAFDTTVVQLFSAALVITPYTLIFDEIDFSAIDEVGIIFIFILA